MKKIDLTHSLVGTLRVTGPAPSRNRKTFWWTKCENPDCGRKQSYRADSLSGPNPTARCRCQDARVLHGGAGRERDSLYPLWLNIKGRIRRQPYQYPLEMEDDWRPRGTGFAAFREYISSTLGERPGKRHSLDRINVLVGYVRHNLRWADDGEQADNRTSSRIFESRLVGAALPAGEWSRFFAESTSDSARWTRAYMQKLLKLLSVDEIAQGVIPDQRTLPGAPEAQETIQHRAGQQAVAELIAGWGWRELPPDDPEDSLPEA